MTAFQFKEWWRYRRAAKGRHGVHSPFVYRLIEEGLGMKLSKELRRQLRGAVASAHQYAGAKTLYRCLNFLNAASVEYAACPALAAVAGVITGNLRADASGFVVGHKTNNGGDGDGGQGAQCVLLGSADLAETERVFSEGSARMKDGLFFIFADPHASPHHALQWLRLREDARVNLSIDLWHIGLLFFNKDFKERQHFVLKYPA